MSLSENLQYLRRREKITQEELADKLQVSRQSVSKWETGEAFPETEKIIALCDIFNVTMDDLMRGNVTVDAAPPAAPCNDVRDLSGSVEREGEEQPDADPNISQKRKKLFEAINAAISAAIMACAIIVYLCIGTMLNLWHPGWLLFPLAISLCAFVDEVFDKGEKKRLRPLGSRIFRGLAGMTMLLSVTIYLFIGCVYGIWHPTWVIFIVAVVLIGAFSAIAKATAIGERNASGEN